MTLGSTQSWGSVDDDLDVVAVVVDVLGEGRRGSGRGGSHGDTVRGQVGQHYLQDGIGRYRE